MRIARKFTVMVVAASTSALMACAGPIATRAGLQGMAMPADATFAVIASPGQGSPLAESARHAVAQELARQGQVVADTGTVRLVVALAERPASLEVLAAGGIALSKAKRPKLLQDCADRTQRLTLAAESPDGKVSRAWAEEDHCNGGIEQSLRPLAAQAVARLLGGDQMERVLRFGTD